MELKTRTGTIEINLDKCDECETKDCAKVCSFYGRSVIKVRDGRPATIISDDEVARVDNECLACEQACPYGSIKITLPLEGLEEYKKKWEEMEES